MSDATAHPESSKRSSGSGRYTVGVITVLGGLAGGIGLCGLSAVQKVLIGYPLQPRGFLTPSIFGAAAGLAVALLILRLLRDRRHYREIFDATSDAIVVHDLQGAILDVNQTMCEAFGYTRLEALELSIGDLSAGENPYSKAEAEGWIGKAITNGPQQFEWQSKRKNGELFWVEVSLRASEVRGEYRVVAAIRDIRDRKRVEESLHRSEARYRDFVADNRVGIYCYELKKPMPVHLPIDEQVAWIMNESVITEANDAAARNYGFSGAQEAIGLTFREVIQTDEQATRDVLRKWIESGFTFDGYESREQAFTGDQRWFLRMNHGVVEDGCLIRSWCTFYDISEQKKVQEELQLTQFAIDNCCTAIYWHGSDGRTFFANEAACRQLGYTKEEMLNLSVCDFDPDWPADSWPSDWQKVKDAQVMTFQSRHRHKDGHIFPVQVTTNYFEFGGNEYVFAFVDDITERVRAEEELRDSEQKLHAIFDHHYQLTGLLDTEGRLLAANKTALDFANADESEVLGRHFWDGPWWNREQQVEVHHACDRAAGGEFVRFETTHPTPSGEIRDFDFSLSPVHDDDGRVVYLVPEGRDITQIKQAEAEVRKLNEELEARVIERTAELQAINEELEAFTYSVSHDLSAPLRHIHGYLRLFMESRAETTNTDALHYVETAEQSALKMAQLIKDLLTLSRFGRLPVSRQSVDCVAMVREILDELANDGDLTRIRCEFQPLPVAQADPTLLRQVWANLLGNAVKYTSTREEPQITVDSYEADQRVWYRIRDNGVGFDQKYSGKLFGVFQRLHRRDEFPGTGVGLAIVQRIVRKHGGDVRATGAVDQGATFEFTLTGAPTVSTQRECAS